MKNIHILPTDKPSRLISSGKEFNLLDKEVVDKRCKNIYITSDEEIKEGYYLDLTHNIVMKSVFYPSSDKNCKKIILTTDPDLIKDGVQAIDDEFLEWFVKNTSCEEVEVKEEYKDGYGNWFIYNKEFWDKHNNKPKFGTRYKIIIPQKESKQETAEEAEALFANRFAKNMVGCTANGFKADYPTLYKKVIIPSIVEQIEQCNKLLQVLETLIEQNMLSHAGDEIVKKAIDKMKGDIV